MQNPIAINPTMPDILNVVKDNPFIGVIDQIKIAQIRKKIGLHNAELHLKPP
jgi:hypothetical protein